MAEKFFLTTPIYYVNARPHIGHSYTTIVADIIAKYHKLKGREVFFLTGTDEHGSKIAEAAEKAGKSPQELCDEVSKEFKETWDDLKLGYDYFVRTTDERHEKAVVKFLNLLKETGDIYKGKYEGLYCTGCEKFLLEKDLVDGKCPLHKTDPKKLVEENYFFKLSKYQDKILDLVTKDELKISPVERKNEVIGFLKNDKLQDLAISRPTVEWGVKLPWDPSHSIYVWVDALLNYVSAIGYEDNEKNFEKYWPPELQLLGKDILRFHCVIWPAMLLSMNLPLPKEFFVHGYFTVDGQKMSKSLGNVVDPIEMAEKYGRDGLRYFLLREIHFGEDGDFSESSLRTRYEKELSNDLGNLLNRTLVMIGKYCDGKIPNPGKSLDIDDLLKQNAIETGVIADQYYSEYEFNKALSKIWEFISECNKYINDTKPWEIGSTDKERIGTVMYNLAESLRIISILIYPVMPETSLKIREQLGVKEKVDMNKIDDFGLLEKGVETKKLGVLFEKLPEEDLAKKESKVPTVIVGVSKDLQDLGVHVYSAVIRGVKAKKKHTGLEKMKKELSEKMKNFDRNNPILEEYRKLYAHCGVTGFKPAAEHLLDLIDEGKLPQINTVVDSYNLVAAEKLLSVGAHDLNKVTGKTEFRFTNGNELFIPLGSTGPAKIATKEYACIDEKQVICRMDVKQCNDTRITNDTKNVLIYVQGNKQTSDKYLEESIKQICENIVKFCGGEYEIHSYKEN